MPKREFEITLKVKVEANSLDVARTIANGIVDDLLKCGQHYVDRPINDVRWNRISPVFSKSLADEIAQKAAIDAGVADAIAYRDQPNDVDIGCPNCDGTGRSTCLLCNGTNQPFPEEQDRLCPGCVNCGPPIAVKADEGCGGRVPTVRELEEHEDRNGGI